MAFHLFLKTEQDALHRLAFPKTSDLGDEGVVLKVPLTTPIATLPTRTNHAGVVYIVAYHRCPDTHLVFRTCTAQIRPHFRPTVVEP